MIRNKGISLLIPILFLAMLILIVSALGIHEDAFSSLQFRAENQDLTLTPWYSEAEDRYYLFLPSFLSQSELTVTHPWYLQAAWEPADASNDLPLDQDISFQISFLLGRPRTYTLRLLPCSAEQTICIDAQEGMLSYLHADQSHSQNVYVTFWDSLGQPEYAGKTTISGRGNSTWQWEKKPYNLSFSQPVTVGPFAQTTKLCLLAEYVDTSKLRNAAAYYTGQALGIPYASPYVYADLFVNGEYLGLYGIATKTEYTKHIEEDGIQAVFELSTSGKGQVFTTDEGKPIRVRYGDELLIQYKVETMEQALSAQDWEEVQQHVDISSWARKYAMDELLYNYDLSLTSEYFYLDSDGLIRCMLPWDYEWTMYPRLYPNEMATEYALCACNNRPNWYASLLELPAFRDSAIQTLREAFTPEFLDELSAYLLECQTRIQDSWRGDQTRWGRTPNFAYFHAGREEIMDALSARLIFLENLFSNWEDFCLFSFREDIDGAVQAYKLQLILPKGTDFTLYHPVIYKSLYTPEGCTLLGVYTEDGTPLENILTVTEDTTLFVRFRPISSEREVNYG